MMDYREWGNPEPNGAPNGAARAETRTDYDGSSITRTGETAAAGIAAQAQAMVQARIILALKNPRDLDVVRARLLKECKRPGFADAARYHKPVGKGIEGPSIRFAECALRCMGNMSVSTTTLYEDEEKRTIRVEVLDLEINNSYHTDITIGKTVERSSVPKGQTPIRVRENSSGQPVYLVAATEDDLLNKQNALASKAIRTNGLRHVPGDIVDECMDLVVRIQQDKTAKDPDAARKAMVDAFGAIGVAVDELKAYVGVPLERLSPAEIVRLRALYSAIRDGETSWSAAWASKFGEGKAETPAAPASDPNMPKDRASTIAEKMRARANASAANKARTPEPPPVAERQPGED